jgi:hypothetical protein
MPTLAAFLDNWVVPANCGPIVPIEQLLQTKHIDMPNWLRAIIAGWGAKKLGGGCLSTILIFVVIYYALGQCNRPANNAAPARQEPRGF